MLEMLTTSDSHSKEDNNNLQALAKIQCDLLSLSIDKSSYQELKRNTRLYTFQTSRMFNPEVGKNSSIQLSKMRKNKDGIKVDKEWTCGG